MEFEFLLFYFLEFVHLYSSSTTKQAAKQTHGGKKRRTIANESNEQTSFDRERFWEVPLTLESNINLTRDSCLVPAEQITLRERDFDEPSQIDDTFDEVCLFSFCFSLGICLNYVQ